MTKQMTITAMAPWFGCNRENASTPGQLLAGCKWIGIPFAGGMPEVPHFKASTIVVNDIHWQVVNMAEVTAHPILGPKFYRHLRRIDFHPKTLDHAQLACRGKWATGPETTPCLEAAIDYFIAVWMGRSAMAGKAKEFSGNLSVRWASGGGDSALRFHNAVRGLPAWRRAMRKCSFSCLDFRKFLAMVKDLIDSGIYCDPPWVEEGDYKHGFAEKDHRDLARLLNAFERTQVVLRYGDHPLIRELYPADRWEWIETESRTSGNNAKAEVLIVRRVAA